MVQLYGKKQPEKQQQWKTTKHLEYIKNRDYEEAELNVRISNKSSRRYDEAENERE